MAGISTELPTDGHQKIYSFVTLWSALWSGQSYAFLAILLGRLHFMLVASWVPGIDVTCLLQLNLEGANSTLDSPALERGVY